MEKSELKGQNIFTADFARKKVADKALESALITVIVIAGAFLMGRVELFGMMSVLPAAFVFSFLGEDRRFYGVWAGAFAGLIFSGTDDLWRYTAILTFAMAVDMAAKDRGNIAAARKAVFCSLAVIITGVFKYIAVMRLDFIIFITAAEALIAFLCAFAFSGAKAKGESEERKVYVYFALAAGISGLGGIDLWGIDMFLTASVFVIMYFCCADGTFSGVAMGTFLGLFALCSGYGSLSVFSAFSAMGLMGAAFRGLGKKGVAAAAVFTGLAMLFYIGGDFLSVYTGVAFAMATLMFAVMPVAEGRQRTEALADSGYDVFKDISAKRMEAVGEAIESIAQAIGSRAEDVSDKERIDRIIDSTVSGVCANCGLSGYCWGSEIEDTYKGFYKFTGECGKNGTVTEKDMPEEIARMCVRSKKLVEVTNRNLDFYRQDMVWEGRIKEYKAADSRRMDIIGRMLAELSSSIKNDYRPDKKTTAKILDVIKENMEKHVKIQAYTVNGIAGVYAIGAGVDLSDILHRATGVRYALTGSSSNGEEADIYTALPVYKATFAVATRPKTGNSVTGDSFGDVCTEKGIGVILSDGMGTGEEARSISMRTVELAESFFGAALSGEMIKELIDTVFLSDTDGFSTMDILETDLYEGRARFTKAGASASFIIRDGKLKTILSPALPPSLAQGEGAKAKEVSLKDGDIIIMLTDGVTDALMDINEDEWIEGILKSIDSRDPRFIAESIIKEAESIRGIASDDMTAAVIRIWTPVYK